MPVNIVISGSIDMKGVIFDIQRFSTHDGYGIRTTVFMKGCNNACLWCHNPEGLDKKPQLRIYPVKCIDCGRCETVCGNGLDPGKCNSCGKCAAVCPSGAREMCGYELSSTELFDVIRSDLDFYKNSGGGVTFSGGEPLLQADFIAETSKLCRDAGISVGIQTAGNVEWTEIEKILPYTDFVMCDFKLYDDEKHKKYTGVSNKMIVENIKKLGNVDGIKLIVRTPVIAGVNEYDAENICKIVSGLKNLDYYEILRYHKFGLSKLENLNMKFGREFDEPSLECLREFKETAEKYIKKVKCDPLEEGE